MQKRLLTEATLTFARAQEIAQNMESAASESRQLQGHGEGSRVLTMEGEGNSCYRCGRQNHQPSQCPFKGAKCHNCGKVGHIQSACRQPHKNPLRQKKGGGRGGRRNHPRGRGRSVKTVQGEESDEEDSPLCHITALNQVNSKTGRPYLVDVQIDGKSL